MERKGVKRGKGSSAEKRHRQSAKVADVAKTLGIPQRTAERHLKAHDDYEALPKPLKAKVDAGVADEKLGQQDGVSAESAKTPSKRGRVGEGRPPAKGRKNPRQQIADYLGRSETSIRDAEKQVELEENLHRKDLTAYERSKATVAAVKAVKSIAEGQAENGNPSERRTGKTKGPKPDPKSSASAADRLGLKKQTVHDADKHVAYAERYPMLQAPDWSQRAAW